MDGAHSLRLAGVESDGEERAEGHCWTGCLVGCGGAGCAERDAVGDRAVCEAGCGESGGEPDCGIDVSGPDCEEAGAMGGAAHVQSGGGGEAREDPCAV